MPEPFSIFSAVAASIPQANVDTDKILPGEFLKTISRTGLGEALFHTLRYDELGLANPDFLLNQSPWDKSGILVALENFGSGSSREHAPWALKDFGIRAILAPSFADIFKQNCIKNGMLTAELSRQYIDEIIELIGTAETAELEIDLLSQNIRGKDGSCWTFDLAPHAKKALLAGEDEITRSLNKLPQIIEHFNGRDRDRPWMNPINFL